MRIALAGEGAIARKHVAALGRMQDVEIAIVAGGDPSDTTEFAEEFSIPDWTLDLDGALEHRDVEAVLLATPTPLHASQALRCLDAGKHILVEIPMAETLEDSESIVAKQRETGLVAMVCHTRRFNPGHVWIHERIASGELKLQHLVVETLFFRRDNWNALGRHRDWTDHLLWHHACHTVDLFRYQTGRTIAEVWSQQGPTHPDLGIAMDMTVALRDDEGVLCSLAMSFNHDGPFGTWIRSSATMGRTWPDTTHWSTAGTTRSTSMRSRDRAMASNDRTASSSMRLRRGGSPTPASVRLSRR